MEWLTGKEVEEWRKRGLKIVYEATGIKTLPLDTCLSALNGYLEYGDDIYIPYGLGGDSGMTSLDVQRKLLELLVNAGDWRKKGAGLYTREGKNPRQMILLKRIQDDGFGIASDENLYKTLTQMPEFRDFEGMFVARSMDPATLVEPSDWSIYSGCRMLGTEYEKSSGETSLLTEWVSMRRMTVKM